VHVIIFYGPAKSMSGYIYRMDFGVCITKVEKSLTGLLYIDNDWSFICLCLPMLL
jgi:hypothetical protein